jgi:Raf kinase inhibitor-like YbhB/YbcL family protein
MLKKMIAGLLFSSALFGLELKSPVFDNGGTIPIAYTCDGKNISPPLVWKDVPKNAKSLVLIMHDPDAPAGDFTHWVVYKIPPTLKGLPEGLPTKPVVEHGINQGMNDFGYVGYGGPCPPPWDKAHRYVFELYALDYVPDIPPGTDRKTVEKALKGHVIEKTTLVGKYKRNKPFMFSKF